MTELTKQITSKPFDETNSKERFWLAAAVRGWILDEENRTLTLGDDEFDIPEGDILDGIILICAGFYEEDYENSHGAQREVELKILFYNTNYLRQLNLGDCDCGDELSIVEAYINCTTQQKFTALSRTIHEMRRKEMEAK